MDKSSNDMYVMISGKIHSRDLGWNNDFGHRKIFSIDFIQIQIFIFKFNVILKVLNSWILGPTKYILEKKSKIFIPDPWNENPKTRGWNEPYFTICYELWKWNYY